MLFPSFARETDSYLESNLVAGSSAWADAYKCSKRVTRLESVNCHAGGADIQKFGNSYTTPPSEVEFVTNAISATAKFATEPPFVTSFIRSMTKRKLSVRITAPLFALQCSLN